MTAAGQQAGAPRWAPGLDPAPSVQRLLHQWGQGALVAPPPLADQLATWMDWRDAVALSQVLATPPTAAAGSDLAPVLDWAQAALARLRTELASHFAERSLVGELQVAAEVPLSEALAPFRLHQQQQQRLLAARVATLRERLRAKLAEAGPRLARLAALDAVFEQALAARERQAQAALAAQLPQRAAALHPAPDWPARLWQTLQQALAAELEMRLQPVLGLIEALHDEIAAAAPPAATP